MATDPATKTPTLPLAEIQAIIGGANPVLVAARNKESDREQHRAVGAEIRSSKVLTDLNRLIGLAYAWWANATPERRKKVRGFSLSLLQLAVHYALLLEAAARGADESSNDDVAARDVREKAAATAFANAFAARNQLTTALRTAAGKDQTWGSRIDTAVGTAEDAGKLANGITRLVKVGRDMLATDSSELLALAESAQLDSDYLDEALEEATALVAADKQAGVRFTATKISQGDLDVLDGVNLSILSDMIHAFERAHERDGTIPRLAPITTRRVLGLATKKSRTTDDGGATTTEDAPTGG